MVQQIPKELPNPNSEEENTIFQDLKIDEWEMENNLSMYDWSEQDSNIQRRLEAPKKTAQNNNIFYTQDGLPYYQAPPAQTVSDRVYEDEFGRQVDPNNQRALEPNRGFIESKAKELSDREFDLLSEWHGLNEGDRKFKNEDFKEIEGIRRELEEQVKDLPTTKETPGEIRMYNWPSLLFYEVWKERKLKGYRSSELPGTPEDTSLKTGQEVEGFKHLGEKLAKTWPAEAVKNILANIQTFMDPNTPEDARIAAATGLASDLGTGGLATAGMRPGVGTFGGLLATGTMRTEGSNIAANAGRAMLMDAKKVSPEEIWKQTGWVKGPDLRWRFEIDDSKAALKEENLSWTLGKTEEQDEVLAPTGMKVGDVLDHPELYKHYPEIKNLSVEALGSGDLLGSYTPGKGNHIIGLQSQKPEDFLSTLLHEVQHYVQEKERFAFGSTPENFLPRGFAERAANMKTVSEDLKKRFKEINKQRKLNLSEEAVYRHVKDFIDTQKPPSKFVRDQLDIIQKHDGGFLAELSDMIIEQQQLQIFQKMATENYLKTFGEFESRLVQERQKFGEGWRSLVFPYKSKEFESTYGAGKDLATASDMVITKAAGSAGSERVGPAAIKVGDEVFTGLVHGEAVEKALEKHPKLSYNKLKEGFVTSEGRFVSREEARDIAFKSKQIEATLADEVLMSEDIDPEAAAKAWRKLDENFNKVFPKK